MTPDTSQAPLKRDDVKIRPVQPADRPTLEQIAAQIWEGNDYLPRVLDDWLQDSEGSFDALTIQDEVVGVGKLTRLENGEWWLEGLRIDPRYQGRGLARIMHHYKVTQARQLGQGVLRFATASDNQAVYKLAAETGFQVEAEFAYFMTKAHPVSDSYFWQLAPDDFERLQGWLARSSYFRQAGRSFEQAWQWRYATPQRLHRYLDEQRIYGWNRQGATDTLEGVLVLNPLRQQARSHRSHKEADQAEKTILEVAYGDAVDDQRFAFWQAVPGLAHAQGADEVRVKIVDSPPFITPFAAQGWERRDWNAVLFSRRLDLTEESDISHAQIPALE